MRKIFFMSLAGYIIGIILADIFCDEILIIPFAILSLLVTLLFLVRNLAYGGIFMSVFLVVGMGVYHSRVASHIDDVSYINQHNDTTTLRVINIPSVYSDGVSFEAEALDKDNRHITRLSVYLNSDTPCDSKYGDVLFVKDLNVIIPEKGYNRGDVDYTTYLRAQGISGVVYAELEDVMYIGNRANPLMKFIYDAKRYTTSVLSDGTGGDEGGFSVALITGDKGYLSDKALLDIECAGLSHIVAVSGMHLGILVMLTGLIFSGSRRKRYIGAFVNIFMCIFMVIFTGGSYSVIRAAIMVIMANTGYYLGRGTYSVNSVLCTGGMIVVFNPFALFDMAFVLSFGATLSIILFEEKINRFLSDRLRITNRFIRSIISVTLSAQILVIPILISLKNTINTYSLIANILVSPVVTILMISSVAAVFVYPFGIVFDVIKYIPFFISKYILKVCGFIANLPYSEIIVSDGLFYVFLFVFAGYLLLEYFFAKRNNKLHSKLKYVYIIFSIFVLCIFSFTDNSQIDFINVGQGDSTLICENGVSVLIDSGGSRNVDSDFGDRVVGAYLKRKGIHSLDYAFITHFDTDHCQGYLSLMKRVKIKKLVVPKPADNEDDISLYNLILQSARYNGTEIIYTSYGDVYALDEGSFLKVVAPVRYEGDDSNSNSLMIMYHSHGINTLICGDNNGDDIKKIDTPAHILKVGHHGASDATSEEFLDKVNPLISVISAGKNNIYSHPHKDVLKMLYKRGIMTFRTDYDGTISIVLGDGKINITTIR